MGEGPTFPSFLTNPYPPCSRWILLSRDLRIVQETDTPARLCRTDRDIRAQEALDRGDGRNGASEGADR